MDLFARFIGLMVVFVIYIAVDVEGVAYGGACTADSECTTDTNADKCDIDGTDKCICNDDSFRQATSSTCIAKLAVDADCVSSDAGTCADTNSECKDDSSGTSNDKCLCKTTHYDASGTCTLKIVLNAACTTSPNGQCADALAACDATTLVCTCSAGNFEQNDGTCAAQIAALGDNCVAAETQPDQCAVDGSECHDDGSGTVTCLCKDTHFTNGAACTTKIVLNAACTTSPNGQCADALAACDGSALVCKCSAGNFEKNDGTCAGQIPNLEDACVTAETASDQCTVAESECRAAQCLCKDTHYKTGTTCTIRKNPDDTACVTGGCVTHATCDTSASPTICNCNAGYTATPTTSPTMCSGVVKFASLSYMYVVPILVSLMFLVR